MSIFNEGIGKKKNDNVDNFIQHYDKVLLAFSPGGLPEMSLIALALETDVPFVAMHHMIRIILIVTLAPFILRFFLSR